MVKYILLTLAILMFILSTVAVERKKLRVGVLATIYNHPDVISSENINIESVRNLQAIKWVFKLLNNINYIKGADLEAVAAYTANSPETASLKVGQLVHQNSNETCPSSITEPLLAIIGPETSTEALVTSSLMSTVPIGYRVPQILYSTTTSKLNDRQKYKNILRVIQSDDTQIQTMIEVLGKNEWTMIAVIYEKTTYGIEAFDQLKTEATKNDICIASSFEINEIQESVTHFSDILKDIMSKDISGIIIFGRSIHTSSLLAAADNILDQSKNNKHRMPLPALLFSEASVTTDRVMKQNDVPYTSGKGAIVMSPPVVHIREFGEYWLQLFKNRTLLLENSKMDPFLLDVYENITGCRPSASNFSHCYSPTDVELNRINFTTLYTPYATHAAFVIAKVLKSIYKECHQNQKCSKLNYTEIQRQLFDLTIQYKTDFPNIVLSGWENKNISYINGEPVNKEYHVTNYRKCLSNEAEYCLETVGYYNTKPEKKLDYPVPLDVFRDFVADEWVPWEKRRKAQCPDGKICHICIPNDLSDRVIYIKGDFIIVAAMPIHNKGDNPLKCSEMRESIGLELGLAIQWQIEKLNQGKKYFDNGSKKIGLLLFDTCNDPLVIQEKIIRFYREGLIIDGQNISNRILGYVGPLGSGPTMAVANVVGKLNYVQVGCCSASSMLGDNNLYPTFLRISMSLDEAVKLMLEIALKLGANSIQIIYSNGEFGENGRDQTLAMAAKYGICVSNNISVEENRNGDYGYIYERLESNSDSNLVFVFLRSHVAPQFARSINSKLRPKQFQFITSDSWGKRQDIINGNENLRGTISLVQEMPLSSEDFEIFIRNQQPKRNEMSNPFLLNFFQKNLDCFFWWSFNKNFSEKCNSVNHFLKQTEDKKFDGWLPFVVNSVRAFVVGTSNAYTQLCANHISMDNGLCAEYISNPIEVRNIIQNVKLDIDFLGKEQEVFNSNGDGTGGYKIYMAVNKSTGMTYEEIGSKQFGTAMELNVEKVNGGVVISKIEDFKLESCLSKRQIETEPKTALYIVVAVLVVLVLFNAAYIIYRVIHYRRQKLKSSESQHYIDPTTFPTY